ncbi:response regulator [Pedobacter sp. Du54]|uniref:ATP-binding response regulator n=1 Tax=Pedobacter anseongensis TaxID=3133439 RepID=UPI0030B69665
MNREYHILVVEDNMGDFVLIEDFIVEQLECPTIKHAKSFKEAEALLLASNHTYNVVLLDLSLPDHNGEKLIDDIISLCHNIPVIVLTGYTNFSFGVKSLSMGVADYLLKEDLNGISLLKSIVYSTERKKISFELEESEQRVRNFANQLNNALEAERSLIAREIHDEFGQQLAGLKMSLSILKKLNGQPDAQEQLINGLIADVNVSIEMVRRIANELRPVLIDKLGLHVALEWLVTQFEKKTGIKSSIAIDSKQFQFDKKVEINIFRICQEALTNIAKHSNATEVELKFEEFHNLHKVTIVDNGIGMNSDIIKNPLSMGLLNMNERSKLIDASLTITSSLKAGTSIELIVKK